ncbi:TrbC/VirB2 family protein [Candidatus Saccharibacteria bacterium]|nr:TrbC/VirB2 family protein [Candidatus Saccharibacteria bacterium]
MYRITGFLASIAIVLGFNFAQAVPAYAQENDIIGGLCTGAELEFSENPTRDCSSSGDATEKINDLIRSVINLLSAIVGVIAVIMIIVGGLRYITSGGNDTSVTSAKNTILYAIIGLIIVALAQVLVRFTLSKIANG